MTTTVVVQLACGHTVPFSIESIEHNGMPTRWWCNQCRVASDVIRKKNT